MNIGRNYFGSYGIEGYVQHLSRRAESEALNHISQKPTGGQKDRDSTSCIKDFISQHAVGVPAHGSRHSRGGSRGQISAAVPLAPPLPLAPEPMGRLHTAGCDGDGAAAELRVGESGGKFVLKRR